MALREKVYLCDDNRNLITDYYGHPIALYDKVLIENLENPEDDGLWEVVGWDFDVDGKLRLEHIETGRCKSFWPHELEVVEEIDE